MALLTAMKQDGVGRMLLAASVGLLLAAFACGSEASDKSDPAGYAQALVNEAVERYEKDGRDKTLAYYNSQASRDGEWYVFIYDDTGEIIARFDGRFVGQNFNEELREDINGYAYGPEMLTATESGKWVSYFFENPGDSNALTPKHTWTVRRDDLFFGAGWYEGIK